MKKITRLLYLCAMILCANLFSLSVKASHCAGGELTYEWVSDSTYKFILKFYRDCTGTTAPASFSLCYWNSCNSTTGSITLNQQGAGVEVAPGCPGYPTKCTNTSSTIPGFQEYVYTNTFTLPSRCDHWTFSTSLSARPGTSLNLTSSGTNGYWYVETTLNNMDAQGFSSPFFTVKPVPYVCLNKPYTFNNGAVDPNGDSLYFQMVAPVDKSSCTSTPGTDILDYNNQRGNGYFNLTNNPFATGNSFTLNPFTGQMSFTPTMLGAWTIAILCKKYRNGILLGTVMRDIQVQVLSCNNVQPAVNTISSTISGATLDGPTGRILGCAGQPLSFCFDVKSTDTGAKLVVTDNHGIVMPGSTMTYTNTYTDSFRGCFSWNPGILDTGLRNLVLTIKDSSCHFPGILITQSFVIPVYISPVTEIFRDTTLCDGDSVKLLAVGGSGFTWTVLPGGSPLTTLSCTSCKSPTARPTVTTRYVVTANNLSYCNKNKDTVTITVNHPNPMTLGVDTVTCINNSLQLSIQPAPSPGTIIKWYPSTYLNNDAIYNPISTPTNDISYRVEVTYPGCQPLRDTVTVTVLQGFKLYTPDTAICAGKSLNVNLTGDSRYKYLWTPSIGVNDVNAMAPTINPDTSRRYTVTATRTGCKDSVASFYLDVQPNPTVFAGADQILCYGDTMTLQWTTVKPASYPYYIYDWNPGGALNNPAAADPIFKAYKTETLTLTVKTPAGCNGSDDIKLTVNSPDIIQVSADTALCPGDTAQLRVTGTPASVIWSPATYISDTVSQNVTAWPITNTSYVVVGTDANNCHDTETVVVTVKPQAVINLPDTVTVYPGDSYQMDPGGNCLYFTWFPLLGLTSGNISNPVATPSVNTRYIVDARTEFGCTVTDTINVLVNPDSYIDVPNAYSPATNSDFKVVHLGNATLKTFKIFNRWGAKMFESSNINEGWDGKLNGLPQPIGVYVYVVEAVKPSGKTVYKQGNFTLLR